MKPRSPYVLLCAGALSLCATSARAQSASDDVEARIQRGVELRRAHQDEAALAEFRAAWESSRAPRARAQMALAAQALGRWVDAEAFLADALAHADDAWLARNRATLERSMQGIREHLASLELRVNVAGAAVRVDGRDAGPFDHPLRWPVGTVRVEVRADGYVTVERAVTLRPDATAREEFTLAPVAPPVAAARVTATPTPTPTLTLTRPTPTPRRGGGRRLAAWMTAGGALALAGAGTVFFFLRNDVVDSFNAQQPSSRCAEHDARSQCADPVRAAGTWETLAMAGWIAGGALAVTSLVLFATSPRGESSARAGLLSHCGVGPASAMCRWSF